MFVLILSGLHLNIFILEYNIQSLIITNFFNQGSKITLKNNEKAINDLKIKIRHGA